MNSRKLTPVEAWARFVASFGGARPHVRAWPIRVNAEDLTVEPQVYSATASPTADALPTWTFDVEPGSVDGRAAWRIACVQTGDVVQGWTMGRLPGWRKAPVLSSADDTRGEGTS